ncbi:hypothetical protein FP744_10004404 [Trichoderma asperellum]
MLTDADHETFWADNEDMREKTKAYEKRAKAVASKGICADGNHPWMKNTHDAPRKLRIFDLERGCRDVSTGNESENARDLLLRLFHWESTQKEGVVDQRSRHLILLEDFSPRTAELLGVLLDIPPDFFLSHCNGLNELSVVNKQLFKQGGPKCWKVAVPQMRSYPQAMMHSGGYDVFYSSFYRGTKKVEKGDVRIGFNSYASYWASSHGAGSWTGVSPCRILKISTCIIDGTIAVVVADPHQSQARLVPGSGPSRVPLLEDFENKMAIDNEAMKDYQTLMRLQESARHYRYLLQLIIYKFRLRDTRCLSVKTPEFHNHMAEEAESWRFLDAKLQYIEESLTNHTKIYFDRPAMEETYEAKMQSRESMRQTKEANRQTAAANRMARSSGQLTKIATIIVPCTFVASIFSMGGYFAAGESLFYVYWIISVPITLGLLFWILHQDVVDAVEKSKTWMNSRKTKLSQRLQA